MILILIIALIAGLTIAVIEIAKRLNPEVNLAWLPFLASLPIPGLCIIYWLFSLWWMQSESCVGYSCDSEGMLAMTVGAAVVLFGSFFVGMTTSILWINWRRKK